MGARQNGDVREIPTVVANIVRGIQPKNPINVLQGKEIMAYIQISPSTVTGTLGTILMNPLTITCQRLRKFAAIYGQYRFRRMEFTVQGNLPTTVGGNLYLGYSRNPDLTIPTGIEAPTAISSMENSMSVSVWSTSKFSPRVETNEWYNVDDDSSEVMKTTQGILFVAQGGIYNITSAAEIPLYLDYVIEARGQQVQPVSQARTQVYPSVQFISGSGDYPSKQWTTSPLAGETLPYPALAFDSPYFLSPSLEVPVLDGKFETASIMVCNNVGANPPGASHNITLYPTLAEYNLGTPLKGEEVDVTFDTSRFTLELVDPSVVSLFSSLRGMPVQAQKAPLLRSTRTPYTAPAPWAYPNSNPWA